MLSGVAAAYFLMENSIRWVIFFVSFAALMDTLDGFLAKRLNTSSVFGQALDSLCDFFVCCIIPMMMVLVFIGNSLLVVLPAAFYVLCGLWRLAYFNATASENRPYYTGMPVPSAALLSILSIWLVWRLDIHPTAILAAKIIAGLLMVSHIRLAKGGLWRKLILLSGFIFLGFAFFF